MKNTVKAGLEDVKDMAYKKKEQPTKVFQYRNLGDFEKVLYLEDQVKGLLVALKRSRYNNGVLHSELEEARYELSKKKTAGATQEKVINQREALSSLKVAYDKARKKLEKKDIDFHKLNIKYQQLKSK